MKLETEKYWSVEAEAAVLGSMLIDSKCIGQVMAVLNDKSFFRPANQMIYNALVCLYLADVPVDAISLRTELKQLNQMERIGGVEYIEKLLDSIPSSANVIYYAGVVRDRVRRSGCRRWGEVWRQTDPSRACRSVARHAMGGAWSQAVRCRNW